MKYIDKGIYAFAGWALGILFFHRFTDALIGAAVGAGVAFLFWCLDQHKAAR